MTNDDEILFTCECCGKQFAPDPDAMLEANFGPVLVPEDEDDELEAAGEGLSEEMLSNMTEYELKEWGLTEQDRQAMLAGENVPWGGVCVCPECREGEPFNCPFCQCEELIEETLAKWELRFWILLTTLVAGLVVLGAIQIANL